MKLFTINIHRISRIQSFLSAEFNRSRIQLCDSHQHNSKEVESIVSWDAHQQISIEIKEDLRNNPSLLQPAFTPQSHR